MKWVSLYIHPDPILGMPRSYLGYVLVMSWICLDHSLGMFWSYLRYTLGISWVWWWSHDISVVVLPSRISMPFLIPYYPMVPLILSREVIVACSVTPPHWPNNHQIHLKDRTYPENTIGYSPLYKQSWEELEAACEYMIDNLSKGFIGLSAAPYTSSILIVWKPKGGLWFCVDYWKLNSII